MRYYRDQNTGELVRFSLETNTWTELRCDRSTGYAIEWRPLKVTPDQARTLLEVPNEDAAREIIDTRKANAAARGEAFLARVRSTTKEF